MSAAAPWRGARILVVGATGFIGRALCRHLTDLGAHVSAASRRGGGPDAAAERYVCDAADADAVADLFERARPDVVYHLASHVSGSRDVDTVAPTLRNNVLPAVNVMTAAVHAGGCRVILAGSLEEPDAANPVPVSPYAAAKGAATSYARMFHALYALPVSVARIFMVYGPEQPNRRMLVPYTVFSLLRGEDPALSAGNRPVDWVYIDDVVEGLSRMGLVESLGGEIVDLGTGVLTPVRRVVEMIQELVTSPATPRFGAVPERPMERVRHADATATRARLGWAPAVELAEGLRRTVEWARREVDADGTSV